MLDETNCSTLVDIIDAIFDEEIYIDILAHAQLSKEYIDFKNLKEVFFESYPKIEKIEAIQTVSIDEKDLDDLSEYHRLKQKEKKLLMKEAYYRGINDMLTLVNRVKIDD
ncbi:MAG: hypothetical protein LUG12_03480 [Erysipelotrichaceae bacterium]|nr:hypothetical protein [Erysipelotrichaceae bacterium]